MDPWLAATAVERRPQSGLPGANTAVNPWIICRRSANPPRQRHPPRPTLPAVTNAAGPNCGYWDWHLLCSWQLSLSSRWARPGRVGTFHPRRWVHRPAPPWRRPAFAITPSLISNELMSESPRWMVAPGRLSPRGPLTSSVPSGSMAGWRTCTTAAHIFWLILSRSRLSGLDPRIGSYQACHLMLD
jgi:hypothetical protein